MLVPYLALFFYVSLSFKLSVNVQLMCVARWTSNPLDIDFHWTSIAVHLQIVAQLILSQLVGKVKICIINYSSIIGMLIQVRCDG